MSQYRDRYRYMVCEVTENGTAITGRRTAETEGEAINKAEALAAMHPGTEYVVTERVPRYISSVPVDPPQITRPIP